MRQIFPLLDTQGEGGKRCQSRGSGQRLAAARPRSGLGGDPASAFLWVSLIMWTECRPLSPRLLFPPPFLFYLTIASFLLCECCTGFIMGTYQPRRLGTDINKVAAPPAPVTRISGGLPSSTLFSLPAFGPLIVAGEFHIGVREGSGPLTFALGGCELLRTSIVSVGGDFNGSPAEPHPCRVMSSVVFHIPDARVTALTSDERLRQRDITGLSRAAWAKWSRSMPGGPCALSVSSDVVNFFLPDQEIQIHTGSTSLFNVDRDPCRLYTMT